jgi:flagellar biosynthesis GTPase FlhF
MEKPISFFSSGQRIPEDLQPAAVDTLLNSILGENMEQALKTKPKSDSESQLESKPKSKPKYGVVAA